MFPGIRIFQVTGECNAAIGRNVGAKESSGETLFFIDGDMEIISESIPSILNQYENLEHPFISGQFINCYDDNKNRLIKNENYFNDQDDKYDFTTGGLFIIKRELWEKVDGMLLKYRISEDLDFGFRLAKINNLLLRKAIPIANHYTIDYKSSDRLWKDFFNCDYLYSNSVLLRDHLLNTNFIQYYLRRNYSLVVLFLLLLLQSICSWCLLLYLPLVLIRTLKNFKYKKISYFISLVLVYTLKDLISILGVVFFWPRNNYKFFITEIKINNRI